VRRRLPEGWSDPEVREDSIVADGLTLRRAALSATGPAGETVTSSAVDVAASPSSRAYFELLERVSTLLAIAQPPARYPLLTMEEVQVGERSAAEVFPVSEDPARWRFARSNGIALHEGWQAASERALWELAERDRVLRSWQGEILPQAHPIGSLPGPLLATASYEWAAYTFRQSTKTSFSREVEVVGVFGFPNSDELPMVSGYAGRPTAEEALDAAVREAMQVLGFLWGEPPTPTDPDLQPTPLHHLEHFQWPAHRTELRRWLAGEHAAYERPDEPGSGPEPSNDVRFVDLTPAWLDSPLRVVKAVCDAAMPLAFGASPFFAHLPPALRVHPIA